MKIVKIINSKMFHGNKSANGYHYYAMYYDRKSKKYNAI